MTETSAQRLLLDILDDRLADQGLIFRFPQKEIAVGGHARESFGTDIVLSIKDPRFCERVLAQGNLGLAESYMEGSWEMVEGRLEDLLSALMRNGVDHSLKLRPKTLLKIALLRLSHFFRRTSANVRAAYDVGSDLYDAFLDETLGYTCGYQLDPSDNSLELQKNKYDRVCQKLQLKAGETLFDIGCGCGGLLIHAATEYGALGRGIVISRDHFELARKRVDELGLKGRVEIELGDFRSAKGSYDKVASLGVFEHLFVREHSDLMAAYKRLLKPGGYALLHTLGCVTADNDHDPFIQKYIFPGSRQNSLSSIAKAVEEAELAILDVENLKPHYAPTVDRWMERFRERRSTLDPKRYDERFCRMWEYYLALCVAATRYSDGAVFQVLMTNSYRRPLRLHRV